MVLGLITLDNLRLKSGKEYDPTFPEPNDEDNVVLNGGGVSDIGRIMGKVISNYNSDRYTTI